MVDCNKVKKRFSRFYGITKGYDLYCSTNCQLQLGF